MATNTSETISPPPSQPHDRIEHVDLSPTEEESGESVSKELANTANTPNSTSLSIAGALRKYPGALWALGPSTGLIMEGMDTAITGGFFSFPSFTRKFGVQIDDHYEETGLYVACQIGQILGLLVAGTIVDHVGYKKTLIGALVFQIAAIAVLREAAELNVYLGGEVILGLTLGAFESLSTSYANDLAPAELRAYLVTYNNMCWILGQLIAQAMLRLFVNSPDPNSYRTILALQWVWPPILVTVVFLMPESPIWLAVRAMEEKRARHSLRKIASPATTEDEIGEQYAQILATDRQEREGRGETSWVQCFRGPDLKRTLTACLVWTSQNLSGAAFIGFAPKFFEKAGLAGEMAYTCSMIFCVAGIAGTLAAWFALGAFGRRTLLLAGLVCCTVDMGLMGAAGLLGDASDRRVGIAVAVLFTIFVAVYDVTLGPVTYVSVGEIPSTRQRAKTVTLARLCYNITGIANFFVVPQMLNADSWNWGPKSAFLFSGTSVVCLVLMYLFVPETKGLDATELDSLFREGVSARKFGKGKVVDIEVGF